jgi:hypothetical protein
MNRYKYLYTFHEEQGVTKDHGLVKITDDNYVVTKINHELTPLEDYGDYLLTQKPVKNPYNIWLSLQASQFNKEK